jgi:hypothetical protein
VSILSLLESGLWDEGIQRQAQHLLVDQKSGQKYYFPYCLKEKSSILITLWNLYPLIESFTQKGKMYLNHGTRVDRKSINTQTRAKEQNNNKFKTQVDLTYPRSSLSQSPSQPPRPFYTPSNPSPQSLNNTPHPPQLVSR